ncbi:MAG: hypothetical protein QM775_15820 [Pirellulales bacterium]
MISPQPHFFLRCEARVEGNRGEWKFALNAADGSAELTANDEEPGLHGDRLELLAVVRALEALDQPSLVTLVAGTRSVRRTLDEGLEEWRRNGWMWESYGEMVPIKNRDLWMRLDRGMAFHKLETRRVFRFDQAHTLSDAAKADAATDTAEAAEAETAAATQRWKNSWHRMRRRLRDRADGLAMSCASIGAPVGVN